MALIDEILNAPTAAIPRQAPPDYPASPDMGGMSPVVENAPQSRKPGFFKQMLANAMQSVYDGNQHMMGNPDLERQKLVMKQQEDVAQKAYYEAQMRNWDADNTRAADEFKYLNEEIPNPYVLPGQQVMPIRRRDIPNALTAQNNYLIQLLKDKGLWDKLMFTEEKKDERLDKTEQGKDRRNANSPRTQGVFIPLTDNQGNLTGQFYNNRTTAIVNNPNAAGTRKSGLPSQENADRASFGTLQTQFKKLGDLVDKNPDKIGPVAGRVGKLKVDYLGGDEAAADLYQTVTDMQNQLIYLASGKQINEQEFARLKAAMPHPDLPPDTFKVRMKNFQARMDEVFKRRTGQMGGNANNKKANDPLGIR